MFALSKRPIRPRIVTMLADFVSFFPAISNAGLFCSSGLEFSECVSGYHRNLALPGYIFRRFTYLNWALNLALAKLWKMTASYGHGKTNTSRCSDLGHLFNGFLHLLEYPYHTSYSKWTWNRTKFICYQLANGLLLLVAQIVWHRISLVLFIKGIRRKGQMRKGAISI